VVLAIGDGQHTDSLPVQARRLLCLLLATLEPLAARAAQGRLCDVHRGKRDGRVVDRKLHRHAPATGRSRTSPHFRAATLQRRLAWPAHGAGTGRGGAAYLSTALKCLIVAAESFTARAQSPSSLCMSYLGSRRSPLAAARRVADGTGETGFRERPALWANSAVSARGASSPNPIMRTKPVVELPKDLVQHAARAGVLPGLPKAPARARVRDSSPSRSTREGGSRPCGSRPSSPPPPLVLSGHAASFTPYELDTPRPSQPSACAARSGRTPRVLLRASAAGR